MFESIKNTIGGGAKDLAASAGEKLQNLDFEKLVPHQVFDTWHAFTHKLLIILIVVIVVLVLFNTVFDKVRQIIRGLDISLVGAGLYWLGSQVPDVILIRELIKPLHKIGLILIGVGVALFIVIRLLGYLAKKGKAAVAGGAKSDSSASDSGAVAAQASAGSSLKRAAAIVLAVVIGAGVGVGADRFIISATNGSKLNSATVEEKVFEIAEMATLESRYTECFDYEGDPKKLFGHKVPFTDKSMELLFSGEIKAGPNMEKASITVDENANTIKVVLPHSKILSHEIDEDSVQIQVCKNGLFNRITPENNNEARKFGKTSKEAKILKTDFLEKADEKAITQLTAFLQSAYPDADIDVRFK